MELLDFYHLKEYKSIDFFYKNVKYTYIIKCILNDSFIIEKEGRSGEFVPAYRGEKLQFFITVKGNLTKCESAICDTKQEADVNVIALSQPKIMMTFERRKYYRQIAILNMNYLVFPIGINFSSVNDIPLNMLKEMNTCRLINISAGGVMIFADEEWPEGCTGMIQLPMENSMNVLVSLIRQNKEQVNNGDFIYEIALKYENITDDERDEILNFIYDQMKKNNMSEM